MKKLLVVAFLCVLNSTASAQFTSSKKSTNTSNSSSISFNSDGWDKIYIQYNLLSLKTATRNSTNSFKDIAGIAIGYGKGINISQSAPIFIEPNASLNYEWYDDDSYDIKIISAKALVNLVYKWDVSPRASIMPYIGLHAKYNFSAKLKYEAGDGNRFFSDHYYDNDGATYEYNLLEENDIDVRMKHIWIGWQFGAQLLFNQKFFLNIGYGNEFSTIMEADYTKYNCPTLSFTAGCHF